MSTTTDYAPFLAPTEEAREHAYADDDTPAGAPDHADPDAPWGRKADGTPKAKPGRPQGTPDKAPRPSRAGRTRRRIDANAPQRKAAPRKKAPERPDYRPGLLGIMQLIAAPLMVAGIKSPALAADALALTDHAENIADAMQETADQVPGFAAALDRILTVGPYGAILAAVLPLGVQIAANHKLLPVEVTTAMGAQSPEDLLAAAQQAA